MGAASAVYLSYDLFSTIDIRQHRRVESMTSEKRVQANRRNALKSTGPKTPEGKAAVRMNALKHGLLSEDILLPGEDGEALQDLGERLRDELRPVGELEDLLVERIVACYWRLGRLGRVEASIFAWEHYEDLAKRAEREAWVYEKRLSDLGRPGRVVVREVDEGKHEEAVKRAEQMRAKRETETDTLGQTFAKDALYANAFSKLSRYEATIERSLYRALHELQRLQANRQADGNAPPPVAIDVDVSGVSGDEH
jgi:hypothetical protein